MLVDADEVTFKIIIDVTIMFLVIYLQHFVHLEIFLVTLTTCG